MFLLYRFSTFFNLEFQMNIFAFNFLYRPLCAHTNTHTTAYIHLGTQIPYSEGDKSIPI